MNKMKLRVVLNLEYDNYGGHPINEFEDIVNEGVDHLIDNGMISGFLEAILEEHTVTVTDVTEEDVEDV